MSTILSRINPKDKLNILCAPTHEGYQTNLSKTGHNFYMMTGPGLKTWDFHTRPLPPNHYIFTRDYKNLNADVHFDIILSQERGQQLPFFIQISQRLGIPIINLDHTEVLPQWNEKQLKAIKNVRADKHVYITEHNRNSWGDPSGTVIPHGIDTNVFNGWTGEIPSGLSIVNYFSQRDIFCGWNLWKQIQGSEVPLHLVGENPGLSESINDIGILCQTINKHRFYLNTSQLSPVPLSCLEAMACGCPIVTTAKQQLPNIVKNDVNGFISNNPAELIEYCKILLRDHDKARCLGENARKTIMEMFSMEKFVENWNSIFYQVIKDYR